MDNSSNDARKKIVLKNLFNILSLLFLELLGYNWEQLRQNSVKFCSFSSATGSRNVQYLSKENSWNIVEKLCRN